MNQPCVWLDGIASMQVRLLSKELRQVQDRLGDIVASLAVGPGRPSSLGGSSGGGGGDSLLGGHSGGSNALEPHGGAATSLLLAAHSALLGPGSLGPAGGASGPGSTRDIFGSIDESDDPSGAFIGGGSPSSTGSGMHGGGGGLGGAASPGGSNASRNRSQGVDYVVVTERTNIKNAGGAVAKVLNRTSCCKVRACPGRLLDEHET